MAKKVSFDYCFLLEFHVFLRCFECRIISSNRSAFVLGRKSQSYRVQREKDRKRKTVLRPNADAILKVSFPDTIELPALALCGIFLVSLK